MSLHSLLLLACSLCVGLGRRVQTPIEHIQTQSLTEHPTGTSVRTQSQEYATHLLAHQLPHVRAPTLAMAQVVTPSASVDEFRQMDSAPSTESQRRVESLSMTMPAISSGVAEGLDEYHQTSKPLRAQRAPSLQQEETQPSPDDQVQDGVRRWQGAVMDIAQTTPQEEMPANEPAFLVFLNYITFGFVGMIAAALKKSNVMDRLNKVSDVASILCAIDCTVFPLLLTVLPLVSAVSTAGATAWLHEASHACALYFVGPVGGLAVITNWIQHKRPLVGLWGVTGITAIILANMHLPHVLLGVNIHAFAHALHEWHTPINVMGCILLLSSQRYARTLVHCGNCGHDHGNDHKHGPNCKH